MTFLSQQLPSTSSLSKSLRRLVGMRDKGRQRQHIRQRARSAARRQFLEQLEPRQMLALNILSVSPLDNAVEVPADSNLVINFNENVNKGQGNIYVVFDSTGTKGIAVDVNSPAVTVVGSQVTIDLPSDLQLDSGYNVRIDSGAFIDTSAGPTAGTTLFTQNFEYEALGPFVTELGGDGTDFTLTPPLGMGVDNSTMGTGGVPEWRGWSFADKNAWAQVDNQARDSFTLATGTIAIADSDEWDDAANTGTFNSFLTTRPIDLSNVTAGSVALEFNSSFRAEGNQLGKVEISYNGGAFSDLQTFLTADGMNSHIVIDSSTVLNSVIGGGTVVGALNSPASGTVQFRFSVTNADNNWWWAIDDVKVTGERVGVPFAGISNATDWNFSTPAALALSMSIAPGTMSENGGTAVGTITRNKLFTDALVVNLSSNDTSEATVPATVTIPAGQSSVTFPITAVDDALSDRTQTVVITATAVAYGTTSATVLVTDDEGPKIVSLVPVDNTLTGVDYRSDLLITFDVPVKKGNGLINILRASDNVIVNSLDVNSADVTIEGADLVARINPTINLPAPDSYYVMIDDGTFLDTSATVTPNTVLLTQDFEHLQLGPFANSETGGDGTDFTDTPPKRFVVNSTTTGGVGSSNWDSWTFADKGAWAKTNGARGQFTKASGTIAVADPNRWGAPPAGTSNVFNSFLTTTSISLTGIAANSVAIEFDSSYDDGLPQKGELQVSYNGGSTWVKLLDFDSQNDFNAHIKVDSTVTVGSRIGSGIVRNKLLNPASGNMQFRFTVIGALTQGWFAIDNIRVTGQTVGVPFQGISDPATWNFNVERPTLGLAIDRTSLSENSGTATATITRNLSTASDLIVTLASSNTSAATVPATVTIPAGQASATFTITGVDNAVVDGLRNVVITATAPPDFLSATASVNVLDISFTPADDSTAVPVNTNLVVNFDADISKGNGTLQILRKSDNVRVMSIDVNSPAVTVAGAQLTIDLPSDLKALTEYYVIIDPGAILYLPATVTPGATLMKEDFEHLALGPAVIGDPGVPGNVFNPNGKDFTATPPTGFTVDNSQMPPGGVPEFYGWTFMDKTFWINEGGQSRNVFTRGSGTIAIGDTDEWDDVSRPSNAFNSLFSTRSVDLSRVAPASVTLQFDSSFRPEGLPATNNQVGLVDVSYDDGATWEQLLRLDADNSPENPASPNVNELKTISVPNPAAGTMKFRFGLTGSNDYWWAIDNILVTGSTLGAGFEGIADPTSWSFTTADTPTLSVTIPAGSIAENGGVANATVSRNLGTTGAVVVNLTSGDPLLATVPASVTIPDGQASITFPITAVDDLNADGLKRVTVTASAAGFVSGSGLQSIADNEVANVKISEIMFNPAGSEPRTEWIEVVNLGTTPADLSGWTFDDEDTTNWGAIPAGTLIQPGKVAVFYNSFFGQNTDTLFRTEWAVPTEAVVVGIFWGDLANGPSATDEILTLIDVSKQVIDTVNYDDDGLVWPGSANGPSIALKKVTLDNDIGTNWRSSAVGVDGGRKPIVGSAVYNVNDVGSPGTIPPIDTTPPAITRVMAGAQAWAADFIDTLDGGGVGAGNGLGFEIVAGATVASLPWSNVNRLYVQFSEHVVGLSSSTLELRVSPIVPANAGVVPVVVNYNPATFLATIDLAAPLEYGKYRLAVGGAVADESGNLLDGDANGSAGGILSRRFNVVPGDTNGSGSVTAADVAGYGASFGQPVTSASFNPRANWNGVGRVTAADVGVYGANFGRNVASLAEPGAAFGGVGVANNTAAYYSAVDGFFAGLGQNKKENTEKGVGDDLDPSL